MTSFELTLDPAHRDRLLDAIASRHSVRSYIDRQIEPEKIERLKAEAHRLSGTNGVRLVVVDQSPDAFGRSMMARYGHFRGVTNYIVVIGNDTDLSKRRAGFAGQLLLLEARSIDLDTCWVGMTFSRRRAGVDLRPDEKIQAVIAFGYGTDHGADHKRKTPAEVAAGYENAPDWFRRGVDAALLAPTALNRQRFSLTIDEAGIAHAAAVNGRFPSLGPDYSQIDLGIVVAHFVIASAHPVMTK